MSKQRYIKLVITSLAFAFTLWMPASAEDDLEGLAGTNGQAVQPVQVGVSKTELDANVSQLKSELRSQRDLTELRVSVLENEIEQSAAYIERLLFAFMLAGGIVVFVVLVTLNKQTGVNNEKMRNLIREADHALNDLHRMLDRPEAEHFHVSRKLGRIMNKMREHQHAALPQKDISDIYAAAQDPTLPVTLHLQANALKQEQSGDFYEAIVLWQRLLEIDGTNPEVLLHLAQNYKKLSEISAGHHVADYRKASLEYFQEYAVRTSTHMSAAHELQQRIGDTTQLPEPLKAKQSAPEEQAQVKHQPQVRHAMPQIKNTASALLESSKSKFSSVKKSPVAAAAFKAVSEVATQVSGLSNATNQTKSAKPESNNQEVVLVATREADLTPPSNGKKKARDAQLIEGESHDQQSKETAIKSTKQKSAKKIAVKKQQNQKKPASADTSSNGKSSVTVENKSLSEEERKRAFSSRLDKAKDYFRRFGSAKQNEQLRWLQAALGELEAAEKYQQNVVLYHLWGITLLEISRQSKGSSISEVRKALEIFSKGEEISEGALCNEIALCYAILKDEDKCRSALEKAKDKGKLNPEIFRDQPEFMIFRNNTWFQKILVEVG